MLQTWDGPQVKQPRNRAEVIALCGDPTRGGKYRDGADPVWERANIVECHGKTAIVGIERWYFKAHRLVEPYFREAFKRAHAARPGYINRAGGFVFRHQRHDPKLPLSLHSYGIAVDINAADNKAVTFKTGHEPKPWSPQWLEIWPRGLPEGVVHAFESCGFAWGGRWRGFVDPMHMQWQGTDRPATVKAAPIALDPAEVG